MLNVAPNAAFYLPQSKGLGTRRARRASASPLPAVSGILAASLPRRLADVASLCGILLLGVTIAAYDSRTPFPGLAAALPCVGAGLIIAAGEGGASIGGKILSWPPLVFIGLISYSLYLWHWPILVFARLVLNHELNLTQRGSLVALIFVVAWLSWRFVERPFRVPGVARASRGRTWVAGGLATTALFGAIGAFIVLRNGLPSRAPEIAKWATEARREGNAFQSSPCLARGAAIPDARPCLLGAPSGAAGYNVALWGDSHAAQLAPALDEIGQRLGFTTREIAKAGCAPVPGVSLVPLDEMRRDCPAFNATALRTVLADRHVQIVVLAAAWGGIAEGEELVTRNVLLRPSVSDSRQLMAASLGKTVRVLADSGHKVIVVGEVPLPALDPISCVSRARFTHQSEASAVLSFLRPKTSAETEDLVNRVIFTGVPSGPMIQTVRPYKYLCGNREKCPRDVQRTAVCSISRIRTISPPKVPGSPASVLRRLLPLRSPTHTLAIAPVSSEYRRAAVHSGAKLFPLHKSHGRITFPLVNGDVLFVGPAIKSVRRPGRTPQAWQSV